MNHTPSKSNNWFVLPKTNPAAEIRLFIFPYAGGGPAAFSKWALALPENIETRIVHYPGRGSRFTETPINKLDILVESIFQAIQPLLDKPFALFGHSLGGLVAYELSHSLCRNEGPRPNILFISACGAPQLSEPYPPIHTYPDPEFVKALREFNGTPSEIVNNPELMELLLPTLRADFEAVERYHYNSRDLPLECPIVAFGGLDDPRVSRERLEGWGSHTETDFKSQYFPGDHFFINTAREAVIASITSELTAAYAKG